MLEHRTPEGPLYRIARGKKPWEFPDWSRASTDSYGAHTFGNRFDDPAGEYRVLYAASQLLSCYVETLARFRPDQKLKEELAAIQGEDDFQPIGYIPEDWFDNRYIGRATVKGRYADLYTAEWVSQLRPHLQSQCIKLGLPELDLSVLMQPEKRIITQMASNYINELGSFAGIYYSSRYGRDLENWALFEFQATIDPLPEVRSVSTTDPAFLGALDILRFDVPRAEILTQRSWPKLRRGLVTRRRH